MSEIYKNGETLKNLLEKQKAAQQELSDYFKQIDNDGASFAFVVSEDIDNATQLIQVIKDELLTVDDVQKKMIDALIDQKKCTKVELGMEETESGCFHKLKSGIKEQSKAVTECYENQMKRKLCRFNRLFTSIITIGSLQAWATFMADYSSDIGYYVAIPKISIYLKYGMLLSIIAPHAFNLVNVTQTIRKQKKAKVIEEIEGLERRLVQLIKQHSNEDNENSEERDSRYGDKTKLKQQLRELRQKL